jgi:hypothetical protein
VPGTTILENYYSGEGQAGSVNFIMYLQNNSCNDTPGAPPAPGAPIPAPSLPLPPGPVQTPGTGPAGLAGTPGPAQTPVLPLFQPIVPPTPVR